MCTSSESVEAEISAKELTRQIDYFLDTLDAESRILFVRRYWYAYSISELAKQFGLKSNTVSCDFPVLGTNCGII